MCSATDIADLRQVLLACSRPLQDEVDVFAVDLDCSNAFVRIALRTACHSATGPPAFICRVSSNRSPRSRFTRSTSTRPFEPVEHQKPMRMFIDRSHTFPGRRVLTCPPVAELLPGRLPRPPGRLDGLAGQLGLPIGEIGNQLVKRNALRCAGAVLDCHLLQRLRFPWASTNCPTTRTCSTRLPY